MIALLSLCALAQTPADPWSTVTTEHFRVYYPTDAEDWAVPMAARLESIRAEVVDEVGYDPPGRMKILVTDPYTTANGAAFPYFQWPRMQFWTTPPESTSILANYGRFDEILAVHETAHMVHLLRPSRNPLVYLVGASRGYGPIASKAPRWVAEGYATLIEARLTGYGRPHSDARAAYLRSLARAGRLPTYAELDGNANWRGMGDAYLVGSAFLEWLEVRAGEGSLRSLWARMTAKQERSFDAAFTGLYGDPPAVLYGRFCAELIAVAVDAEARRPEVAGERFLELQRDTSAPAVSPDGTQLAAVISDDQGRSSLRVWATAVDEEAETAARERADKRAARDPADVRDLPPKARPHEVLATRMRAWREPDQARWNGTSLLFGAYTAHGNGKIRPDVFEWTPGGGERRVTRGEDVAQPDPAPDGTWAIGVRKRLGATDLVRVDLATGDVTPFYDAPIGHVVDHPRVSRDGATVLWLENGGAGWGLRVAHADGTEPVDVAIPEGATIVDPAWDNDGAILASLGVDGFFDVWQIAPGGGAAPITRTDDGALGPEAMPDGSILYLSLAPDGMSIRRIVPSAPPAIYPIPAGSVAFRVSAGELPAPFAQQELHPKAYGLGPVELRPILGGWSGQGAGITAIGLRAGDIVGRWEAMGQVAYGYGTPGGARGTLRWAGLPVVDVTGGAYTAVDDRHGRWGVDVTLEATHRFETAAIGVMGGAILDRPLRGDPLPARTIAFAELSGAYSEGRTGFVHVAGHVRGRFTPSVDGLQRLVIARGTLALGRTADVELAYEAGATDAATDLDGFRLGGVPTIAAPEAWAWHRLWVPGVAVGESAHFQDAVSASAWFGAIEAFVERHRTGQAGLGKSGTSLAGARIRLSVDEQPFVKLPAIDFEVGTACRVEDPVDGLVDDLCTSLADWSLWSGLSWTP